MSNILLSCQSHRITGRQPRKLAARQVYVSKLKKGNHKETVLNPPITSGNPFLWQPPKNTVLKGSSSEQEEVRPAGQVR
ncbi:putative agnoprotein 2 [possum polyomavirus]|nr:putative agnoprotein 2 [possum polyomavirus]